MKLFRKPRDDRLAYSAAKGINNAYHSKNLSPLRSTLRFFHTKTDQNEFLYQHICLIKS